MNVYIPCLSLVSTEVRRQTSVSDPLELELWIIVSLHVDAWKQTQVLSKNKCSSPQLSSQSQGFQLLNHCAVVQEYPVSHRQNTVLL